jgi:hypothetical protein
LRFSSASSFASLWSSTASSDGARKGCSCLRRQARRPSWSCSVLDCCPSAARRRASLSAARRRANLRFVRSLAGYRKVGANREWQRRPHNRSRGHRGWRATQRHFQAPSNLRGQLRFAAHPRPGRNEFRHLTNKCHTELDDAYDAPLVDATSDSPCSLFLGRLLHHGGRITPSPACGHDEHVRCVLCDLGNCQGVS